jgi:hypothetical protein
MCRYDKYQHDYFFYQKKKKRNICDHKTNQGNLTNYLDLLVTTSSYSLNPLIYSLSDKQVE